MVAKIIWLKRSSLTATLLLVACQTVEPMQSIRTPDAPAVTVPMVRLEPTNKAQQSVKQPAAAKRAPSAETSVRADGQWVVTRLQQEALVLQGQGNWSAAELKLDRALRIDADKVDLYHQLATVRMGQKRFAQAEQIALKGLTLTDRSPKFRASLWQVIGQCRSAQGDIRGARQARHEMSIWLLDGQP
ncbi:hypothetical protein [Reinekea sp.]|jgi:predicted Zn-dependent protease|uniref:hypothetical protein n=1 Tax=Reinekea sp. TaxID=1970455 RepID=UPI002A7FCEF2|nr:hypothetical protein [Reinekea sp.]